MSVLLILTLLFAALAFGAFIAAIRGFRKGRGLQGSMAGLVGLMFIALAALSATLSAATYGYHAFTREEVAAIVEVRPTDEHAFEATVHLPDENPQTYQVRGDQLYVDARIVKWQPFLNVLGLHTAYELDRLSGRYRRVDMANEAQRTVFRLGPEQPLDLLRLLDSVPLLEKIVDAEYGSATFVEVDRERMLEVRVSTSGLLIREAEDETNPGTIWGE